MHIPADDVFIPIYSDFMGLSTKLSTISHFGLTVNCSVLLALSAHYFSLLICRPDFFGAMRVSAH